MRVENVKGAVWTVDEVEFMKRRPQRLGRLVFHSSHLDDGWSVSFSKKAITFVSGVRIFPDVRKLGYQFQSVWTEI